MNHESSYNPLKHHRRSIRMQGYDYAQQGLFFVTICIKNRICLFGEIINKEMKLNDAGRMIEKWYAALENKFPDIKCHEYVVMPNHFHCIIENVGTFVGADAGADIGASVGADPCVRPDDDGVRPNDEGRQSEEGGHIGPPLQQNDAILGEHGGSPLGRVLQWFKTMTTNEYIRNVTSANWPVFEGRLWQRNYWEHIIRNTKSHDNISAYIVNNPYNWETDSINPNNEKKR